MFGTKMVLWPEAMKNVSLISSDYQISLSNCLSVTGETIRSGRQEATPTLLQETRTQDDGTTSVVNMYKQESAQARPLLHCTAAVCESQFVDSLFRIYHLPYKCSYYWRIRNNFLSKISVENY